MHNSYFFFCSGRGNEAEKVASFKDALGISDEDAAAVHMDVGRRLARLSVESENKLAEMEARKVRICAHLLQAPMPHNLWLTALLHLRFLMLYCLAHP